MSKRGKKQTKHKVSNQNRISSRHVVFTRGPSARNGSSLGDHGIHTVAIKGGGLDKNVEGLVVVGSDRGPQRLPARTVDQRPVGVGQVAPVAREYPSSGLATRYPCTEVEGETPERQLADRGTRRRPGTSRRPRRRVGAARSPPPDPRTGACCRCRPGCPPGRVGRSPPPGCAWCFPG